MENLSKFLAAALVMLAGTLMRGIVIVKLWDWFIATQFQLPLVNMAHGLGIGLLVSFLTLDWDKKPAETNGQDFWVLFSTNMLKIVLVGLITLLFGFIFKSFL